MNYEIIASGSKGNCVIVNDVMVDVGVPFNKIKDKLYDIKYLLLTHIHTDHIKPSTLKSVKQLFPRIKIIGNHEVYQKFGVNVICNAGFDVVTDDYTFLPFECEHDVLTYGYVWSFEAFEILYTTDTSSITNAPNKKYDYLFLESNHDEKKLEKASGQIKGNYNPYLSGKRHLSTQDAKAFYYLNRRDKDSKWIELHCSSRFY